MAHWDSAKSNLTYWAISGTNSEVGTKQDINSINHRIVGVAGHSSGKKFFEIEFDPAASNNVYSDIGVCTAASGNAKYPGGDSGSWGFLNSRFYSEGSQVAANASPPTTVAVYGFLIDLDNGKAWLVIDGTIRGHNGSIGVTCSLADVESGTNPAWSSANMVGVELFPAACMYVADQTATLRLSAAEQSSFTLPSGYEPWVATANSAAPYIDDSRSNLTYYDLSGVNTDKATSLVSGTGSALFSAKQHSSGKLYAEFYNVVGTSNTIFGIATPDHSNTVRIGFSNYSWGWMANQRYYHDGVIGNSPTATTGFNAGDILGIAVDLEAGKIWFSRNGNWLSSGDPAAGTNPAYEDADIANAVSIALAGTLRYVDDQAVLRVLESDFTYTPPTGFSPWDEIGGGGPVSFRLVHDLYYDLSGVRFLVVLDHFYHLLAGFRKEQAHIYGLRMCIEHALYYGSMPTFRRAFPRRYTNAPHLRKVFDRLYHDLARFTVEAERGYDIRGGLRLVQELSYMIAGAGFRLELPHHYELMEYDRFRKAFARLYAIAGAGSVTQKPVHTVRIGLALLGGVKVINVSALREQDVIVAEVQTASQADALLAARWAEVEVTIGDDVYVLVVSRKPRRARTTEAADTWVVTASSPAVLLDRDVLVRKFEPGWASAIAAELAAPYGVSVSWEIVDWLVPADTLFATNESSLAVIDKLARAGGGIKQSAPDGTLRIIPAYPVSVNRWGTAEPEFIVSDLYDLFSHDDEGDERSGYNSFTVSNLLSASQNAWLEYVDLTGTRKEIRGYDVPRVDGRRFSVTSSGGSWVSVEPMGEVEEVIEEQVELFGGVGRLSKPCYGLLSVDWRQRQLGALSYSEDGTVQAEVAGASLALVRYTTRYWRWLARNARVEDVQFVREVEDGQSA